MTLYKVDEMSCGHCVKTIEAAVRTFDGSATVICDLAAKTVAVESKAEPAAIRAVLDHAGYAAVPVG